jgi:hypothetical protein
MSFFLALNPRTPECKVCTGDPYQGRAFVTTGTALGGQKWHKECSKKPRKRDIMSDETVIKLDDHQTNFLTVALAEALKAAEARKQAAEQKASARVGGKDTVSGKLQE